VEGGPYFFGDGVQFSGKKAWVREFRKEGKKTKRKRQLLSKIKRGNKPSVRDTWGKKKNEKKKTIPKQSPPEEREEIPSYRATREPNGR